MFFCGRNASSGPLRDRPHDSGPTWIVTPFVVEDVHLLHPAGLNRRYLPCVSRLRFKAAPHGGVSWRWWRLMESEEIEYPARVPRRATEKTSAANFCPNTLGDDLCTKNIGNTSIYYQSFTIL